jgi:hypothetical protein
MLSGIEGTRKQKHRKAKIKLLPSSVIYGSFTPLHSPRSQVGEGELVI